MTGGGVTGGDSAGPVSRGRRKVRFAPLQPEGGDGGAEASIRKMGLLRFEHRFLMAGSLAVI
jgi:hypothetical protein